MKPGKTQDPSLAFFETSANVAGELTLSAYEIQELLTELFAGQSDAKMNVDVVAAKRADLSGRIFAKMGTSLASILYTHVFRAAADPDWRFYFWPGYNRIKESASYRETLSIATPDDGSIHCGLGVDSTFHSATSIERSALWYHRALTVHKDDTDGDKHAFIPGGTHGWAASYNGQDRWAAGGTPRPRKVDDLPFLEVFVRHNDSTPTLVPRAYSDFVIPLATNDWGSWPEDLSTHLNALGRKFHALKWPHPLEPNGDARDEQPALDKVRLELYRIWLAATFGPRDEDAFRTLLATVDAKLEQWDREGHLSRYNITALRNRLHEKETDNNILWRPYKYWYTVPTDAIFGEDTGLEPLGSAMLLTTHRIPLHLFLFIRPWVNGIYSQLRRFDQLIDVRQKTRISQDKANRQTFAHSVQGYINPINGALRKLGTEVPEKNAAEAAVRQLQFAVNLFSHRPFTQIPEQLRKGRPLQWEQCVQDAHHLALARLIDRCGIGSTKSFDGGFELLKNGKEINDAVRNCVIANHDGPEGWGVNPDSLLMKIGLQKPLSAPQRLASTWNDDAEEGLYTYVLTQAIFHAAVFSCLVDVERNRPLGLLPTAKCRPPYLKVTVSPDSHQIVVANRAISANFAFENTTDSKTLGGIVNKFNGSISNWVSVHTSNVASPGDWFEISLRFQHRTYLS